MIWVGEESDDDDEKEEEDISTTESSVNGIWRPGMDVLSGSLLFCPHPLI